MAGIQNNAARQIDLRGRRPGQIGANAICCITLNPGFNVVEDADLDLCLKNRHVTTLIDAKVIVVGVRRTRLDEALQRDVDKVGIDPKELRKPAHAASLAPGHGIASGLEMDTPAGDALEL